MQQETAQLLWDMENFYDSVDLVTLSSELILRDSPPELLILGILAHAAPRLMRGANSRSHGPVGYYGSLFTI